MNIYYEKNNLLSRIQEIKNLIAEEKLCEAKKILESLYKSYPKNKEVLLNYGYVLDNLGEYNKAVEVYKNYVNIEKNDAWGWFNLGVLSYEIGHDKLDEALKYFSEVIKIYKEGKRDVETLHLTLWSLMYKAFIFKEKSKISESFRCINSILKIKEHSENPDLLYNLGVFFYTIKDYNNALENFKKAIKRNRSHINSLFGEGCVYLEMKQPTKAIKSFDEAINIIRKENSEKNKEKLIQILYNKGVALGYQAVFITNPQKKEEKLKEEIECYNEIISLDPKNYRAWNAKGYVLVELGEYEFARQCLEIAYNLESNDPYILHSLAEFFYLMGSLDKAEEYIKEAIDKDLLIYEIYVLKGKIYLRKGNVEKAIECFKEAEKIQPENIISNMWLAYSHYLETSKIKEEKEKYFRLSQIIMEVENMKDYITKKLENQEYSLNEAAQIYYWLSTLYFKIEDYITAKKYMEEVLEIKKFPDAKRLLEYLWNYVISPPWYVWWWNSPKFLDKWKKRIVGSICVLLIFLSIISRFNIYFLKNFNKMDPITLLIIIFLSLFILFSPFLRRLKVISLPTKIEAEYEIPLSYPIIPHPVALKPILKKIEKHVEKI